MIPAEPVWRDGTLFTPPLGFPYRRDRTSPTVDAWIGDDQWLAGLPSNRNEQFGWWQVPGLR
jgi:hypothetical protein